MRVAVFDTHHFDRKALELANRNFGYQLVFYDLFLRKETAALAAGFDVVCPFVNDRLDAPTLRALKEGGVRLIAMRCAGFNNVDLIEAAKLDLRVVRVPEYSPYAVAEHAAALILTLNRKVHRAHARVREGNFALDGLVGFDLHGKTVGLVGTGRIGRVFARIMHGFGCRLLACDITQDPALIRDFQLEYSDLNRLFEESDIISLHVPLTPETRHIINAESMARMKHGLMLINTSRGALIDSRALLQALKSGRVGSAGLDVYEEEEAVFFRNLSDEVLQDDVLARLMTFPNVLITSHQAFLTEEALTNIARTTLENIRSFQNDKPLQHEVAVA